jgi:acyl-coenzyme A thioesterase PaaI-like protein
MQPLIHPSTLFRHLINLYPPYLFTGIKVSSISQSFHDLNVDMTLRWYNKNYVGTHFGGSLFAMTDPWFMLMLMQILGKDYVVWDSKAAIDFIKPGKGKVSCHFHISDSMLEEIKKKTQSGDKFLPVYEVHIRDQKGDTVATIKKEIYIRKKKAK